MSSYNEQQAGQRKKKVCDENVFFNFNFLQEGMIGIMYKKLEHDPVFSSPGTFVFWLQYVLNF